MVRDLFLSFPFFVYPFLSSCFWTGCISSVHGRGLLSCFPFFSFLFCSSHHSVIACYPVLHYHHHHRYYQYHHPPSLLDFTIYSISRRGPSILEKALGGSFLLHSFLYFRSADFDTPTRCGLAFVFFAFSPFCCFCFERLVSLGPDADMLSRGFVYR